MILIGQFTHACATWPDHAVYDPIVATFDASGRSPQCSQGGKSYMRDCCFGTDFYFYIDIYGNHEINTDTDEIMDPDY